MKVYVITSTQTWNPQSFVVGVEPTYELAYKAMADDFRNECEYYDVSMNDNENAWMEAFSAAIALDTGHQVFWSITRRELKNV